VSGGKGGKRRPALSRFFIGERGGRENDIIGKISFSLFQVGRKGGEGEVLFKYQGMEEK